MKKWIFSKGLLTGILIVLILAVLVYVFVLRKYVLPKSEEAADTATEEAIKPEDAPLPVKVGQVIKGDLVISLRSPGEAVTNKKIDMKAEVKGLINALNVQDGRRVRAGDILIEIDDQEYRLDLESAEADRLKNLSDLMLEQQFAEQNETDDPDRSADLEKARQDYDQAREMYHDGRMDDGQFEEATRLYERALIESGQKKDEIMAAAKGLTQSEIRVKKARMNLDRTKIRAPFSGVVFDVKVSPSENVSVGQELFTLVNIDRIQVHAKVLESEIGKMRVGREAGLKFSAYPEREFMGRVAAISPVINPEDRTCIVIIDMANPGEEIKPGMHAEVKIVTDIYQDRLLVPQEAILTREGRKLVFVVDGELAKWRYVQIGLENEDYAEILPAERAGEGVSEGEAVIVDGHFTLAHDARVRITE